MGYIVYEKGKFSYEGGKFYEHECCSDHLMNFFIALAESNRLQIVELLRNGPLTVGEIANRLGLNQPQASKHLRILSDAGLVEVHPIANRRVYKLKRQAFQDLDNWLDSFLHMWEDRFDRLDDYLHELQSQPKKKSDAISPAKRFSGTTNFLGSFVMLQKANIKFILEG
jgi:DNA-binding transcriptional ArsR family regulator